MTCPCSLIDGAGVEVTLNADGSYTIAASEGPEAEILACIDAAMGGTLDIAGGVSSVVVSSDPGNQATVSGAGVRVTPRPTCDQVEDAIIPALVGPGLTSSLSTLTLARANAVGQMLEKFSFPAGDPGLFADANPRRSDWEGGIVGANGWQPINMAWAIRQNVLYVRGRITGPAAPVVGQQVATWPVGTRPTTTVRILGYENLITQTPQFTIDTAGVMTYASGNIGASAQVHFLGTDWDLI